MLLHSTSSCFSEVYLAQDPYTLCAHVFYQALHSPGFLTRQSLLHQVYYLSEFPKIQLFLSNHLYTPVLFLVRIHQGLQVSSWTLLSICI